MHPTYEGDEQRGILIGGLSARMTHGVLRMVHHLPKAPRRLMRCLHDRLPRRRRCRRPPSRLLLLLLLLLCSGRRLHRRCACARLCLPGIVGRGGAVAHLLRMEPHAMRVPMPTYKIHSMLSCLLYQQPIMT